MLEDEVLIPSSMKSERHDGPVGYGDPVMLNRVAQTVERFAEDEVGYDVKGCIVYRIYNQSESVVQNIAGFTNCTMS